MAEILQLYERGWRYREVMADLSEVEIHSSNSFREKEIKLPREIRID